MRRSWGFALKLLTLLVVVLMFPSLIKWTWSTTMKVMDYVWDWSSEWAMRYFGELVEQAKNITITVPT